LSDPVLGPGLPPQPARGSPSRGYGVSNNDLLGVRCHPAGDLVAGRARRPDPVVMLWYLRLPGLSLEMADAAGRALG
ncbi:MAG TPA: hypothetical protein VFA32_12710, partial [Dehalococcoidia bacterium]|nr:hypothetical protein [Dehalococcoidia bacterium]